MSPNQQDVAALVASPDSVGFPAYGKINFDDLGSSVKAATWGLPAPYEFDPDFYPGHQIVGTINFNSLNRIVTWFVQRALLASEARATALEARATQVIRTAHVAMTLACALPGVAGEYDFSEAIAATEAYIAKARAIPAPADGRGDQMLASASYPQEPVKDEASGIVLANCCHCGRIIDTREKAEGGDAFGAELSDHKWVCSPECWDIVVEARNPAPPVGSLPNLADATFQARLDGAFLKAGGVSSKDLPSEARPVAWRWRPNPDAAWVLTTTDSHPLGELEPLYVASPLPSEARADGVRAFQEWLNARRDQDVSSIFHDLVAQFRSALTAPDHGDVASQGGDK